MKNSNGINNTFCNAKKAELLTSNLIFLMLLCSAKEKQETEYFRPKDEIFKIIALVLLQPNSSF